MRLHKNGWLGVNIPKDYLAFENNAKKKEESYRNNHLKIFQISQNRISYLVETIKYLSDFDCVYLIRIPVHPLMLEIENELMPNFDQTIMEKVEPFTQGYLNMIKYSHEFMYTDGNHLFKGSSEKTTRVVANWILSKKSSKCK